MYASFRLVKEPEMSRRSKVKATVDCAVAMLILRAGSREEWRRRQPARERKRQGVAEGGERKEGKREGGAEVRERRRGSRAEGERRDRRRGSRRGRGEGRRGESRGGRRGRRRVGEEQGGDNEERTS